MKCSTLLVILVEGALAAPAALNQQPPSGLPTQAKCWSIPYSTSSITAAGTQAKNLPIGSIQGFPMRYPLSNLHFPAWDHGGGPFPASGAPFAPGCDTHNMQKFPLVPPNLAGANGAWDGTKSRSSAVDHGYTQSDFVFVDGEGRFCLIATEIPYGVGGWLPCWWQ